MNLGRKFQTKVLNKDTRYPSKNNAYKNIDMALTEVIKGKDWITAHKITGVAEKMQKNIAPFIVGYIKPTKEGKTNEKDNNRRNNNSNDITTLITSGGGDIDTLTGTSGADNKGEK